METCGFIGLEGSIGPMAGPVSLCAWPLGLPLLEAPFKGSHNVGNLAKRGQKIPRCGDGVFRRHTGFSFGGNCQG